MLVSSLSPPSPKFLCQGLYGLGKSGGKSYFHFDQGKPENARENMGNLQYSGEKLPFHTVIVTEICRALSLYLSFPKCYRQLCYLISARKILISFVMYSP